MRAARTHKMVSQQKKRLKNRPILPRTAGLVTLSEMTEKLTKAGIDPSRVVERAQLLAKARGAEKKRKRDEMEAEMDVDAEEEGDWMDVDGDDGLPRKRQKDISGAGQAMLYGKRVPKTDRTTIGMRDGEVCCN
jgi:nucleolar GTP-binding protein